MAGEGWERTFERTRWIWRGGKSDQHLVAAPAAAVLATSQNYDQAQQGNTPPSANCELEHFLDLPVPRTQHEGSAGSKQADGDCGTRHCDLPVSFLEVNSQATTWEDVCHAPPVQCRRWSVLSFSSLPAENTARKTFLIGTTARSPRRGMDDVASIRHAHGHDDYRPARRARPRDGSVRTRRRPTSCLDELAPRRMHERGRRQKVAG
jgi:hypothetical protein